MSAAGAPVRRYGWIVGVAAVIAIVYVSIDTLGRDTAGGRGLAQGARMPPFAVPLATGALQGDANVATKPRQGAAGDRPACAVRGPQILNVCQLWERGPVVLAFLATRGGTCIEQLDGIERVAPRFAGVQFAAVGVRGKRATLRDLVRRHGWTFPVGYDADGVVSNIYGVSGCPQITFAEPGGRVGATTFGRLSDRDLTEAVARLVAGARRRGWEPPP